MGNRRLRSAFVGLLLLGIPACGGGGGGGGGGGSGPPLPPAPDISLLFVSGHNGRFDGAPSESYLQEPGEIGPAIVADLQRAGYSLTADYFVDDAFTVNGHGGYLALVDVMEYIRDEYAPRGTRVVVIAHSHGGVWAHQAIRSVPGLAIAALVDLDCNSYGWGIVGHDIQNDFIDGDPRDVFDIGLVVTPFAYPTIPSEQTGQYDVEDVVFMNVTAAFEVRTGDSPLGGEWFDEKWTIRRDGTTGGIAYHYSGTDHNEPRDPLGPTYPRVHSWLVSVLD